MNKKNENNKISGLELQLKYPVNHIDRDRESWEESV